MFIVFNCISFSDAKGITDRYFWKVWIDYAILCNNPFGLSPLNDWLKQIIPNPRNASCFDAKLFRRAHQFIDYYVIQLLNGKGYFGKFLSDFKMYETSECPICFDDWDDHYHTLFGCINATNYLCQLESIGIFGSKPSTIFDCLTGKNNDKGSLFAYICQSIMKYKAKSFNDLYPP